ncbi:hypothetical protein EHQ83_10655 [Leptospira yasudae]|uniref:Uncharacterized protein n=1 Tax=Leptospira yasudae TaxID=2202201 RepID=A0A6N4QUM1_9LEPT|nr:hypothetical protein EHQ72_18630 [Leptospira yasudae]TGL79468.1 hypothetical protein EHQ77_10510 [Leptospira yasudae]TGL84587.1 hypothetical protein EHQ83_10655 [Leptospira yasudae]
MPLEFILIEKRIGVKDEIETPLSGFDPSTKRSFPEPRILKQNLKEWFDSSEKWNELPRR